MGGLQGAGARGWTVAAGAAGSRVDAAGDGEDGVFVSVGNGGGSSGGGTAGAERDWHRLAQRETLALAVSRVSGRVRTGRTATSVHARGGKLPLHPPAEHRHVRTPPRLSLPATHSPLSDRPSPPTAPPPAAATPFRRKTFCPAQHAASVVASVGRAPCAPYGVCDCGRLGCRLGTGE